MKNSALLREIWRDIRSGTAWTVIFSFLSSIILMGLAVADLTFLSRLNNQATYLRNSMASVTVLEAPGHINPNACLALTRYEGVKSVVAIRSAQSPLTPSALPSTPIRTFEATGDIPSMLRMSTSRLAPSQTLPDRSGVYLVEGVADTLGQKPGDSLELTTASTKVIGVFPWKEDDGRRPGFAYSLFAPVPPSGAFDECWVDIWPMTPAFEPLIRSTASANHKTNENPKLYPFNSSFGTSFDGNALFHNRLSAWAPWGVVVAGVALGWVSVWRRRLEISSDIHAGVAKRDLFAKLGAESAAWIFSSIILSLPLMTWIIVRNPFADQASMWKLAGIYATLAAVSSFIGAAIATATVREKQLLRFFKQR